MSRCAHASAVPPAKTRVKEAASIAVIAASAWMTYQRLRAAYGAGNQIIVTSRIAGFHYALDGYSQLEVQELDQAQIDLFVRSWFADTADPDERERRIDGLLRGLGRSPRMRLLAQ